VEIIPLVTVSLKVTSSPEKHSDATTVNFFLIVAGSIMMVFYFHYAVLLNILRLGFMGSAATMVRCTMH
jgi:hypothetical protein